MTLLGFLLEFKVALSSILQTGVYCTYVYGTSPKRFTVLSACVYHISCERDIKSKRKHTLLSFTSHCHIILASKPSFARLSSQSLRADLIWSNQNRTTKIFFESCCLWHMEMVLCGSILLFLVCWLYLLPKLSPGILVHVLSKLRTLTPI